MVAVPGCALPRLKGWALAPRFETTVTALVAAKMAAVPGWSRSQDGRGPRMAAVPGRTLPRGRDTSSRSVIPALSATVGVRKIHDESMPISERVYGYTKWIETIQLILVGVG